MLRRPALREIAFVCFNTRGVPGSGGAFADKTLTADLEDLELVCAALPQLYPSARRLFLCGMSTGTFSYHAGGRVIQTRLFYSIRDHPYKI